MVMSALCRATQQNEPLFTPNCVIADGLQNFWGNVEASESRKTETSIGGKTLPSHYLYNL